MRIERTTFGTKMWLNKAAVQAMVTAHGWPGGGVIDQIPGRRTDWIGRSVHEPTRQSIDGSEFCVFTFNPQFYVAHKNHCELCREVWEIRDQPDFRHYQVSFRPTSYDDRARPMEPVATRTKKSTVVFVLPKIKYIEKVMKL